MEPPTLRCLGSEWLIDGEPILLGSGAEFMIDVHTADHLFFENLTIRDPGADGGAYRSRAGAEKRRRQERLPTGLHEQPSNAQRGARGEVDGNRGARGKARIGRGGPRKTREESLPARM